MGIDITYKFCGPPRFYPLLWKRGRPLGLSGTGAPSSVKNREVGDGGTVLKCKKIFYISIDASFVSAYNKSEEMQGGHHNEV